MDLADEVLDHFFGDFEVGDNAVAQGSDRVDVAGCAPEHQFRVFADGEHLLAALVLDESDDRRLVEDDAPAADVDQRVGGSEVDRHVGGQEPE